MKVYVAAKWQLKDQVKQICEQLEERGHEITSYWFSNITQKPYSADPESSGNHSNGCLEGVLKSDVFILLISEGKGVGKFIEFGAALANNYSFNEPLIYIIGDKEHFDQSEFYFHPSVKIRETIEEVIEELDEL